MRDPYIAIITKAVIKLIQEGIRDPSVSEIASTLKQEPLPSDPLTPCGVEMHGVIKRLPWVRRELEDSHNIQCALINSIYYEHKMRGRIIDDIDTARVCLPAGPGRKAAGLFAAKTGPEGGGDSGGDHNLIYQVWLEFNGKPGASRARRSLQQAINARNSGTLTTPQGVALAGVVDSHLTITPQDAILQIKASTTPQ